MRAARIANLLEHSSTKKPVNVTANKNVNASIQGSYGGGTPLANVDADLLRNVPLAATGITDHADALVLSKQKKNRSSLPRDYPQLHLSNSVFLLKIDTEV